jgi:hypothetical protein
LNLNFRQNILMDKRYKIERSVETCSLDYWLLWH